MEIKGNFFGSAATTFCKYFFENLLHCAVIPIFLTLSTAKTTIQTAFTKNKEGLLDSHLFKTFPDPVEVRASFLPIPKTRLVFH